MIELEKKLKEIILEESGAIGYELKLLEVSPRNGQVGGSNNLLSTTITIYVSPNFEIDEAGKNYLKAEAKEALEIILCDIARHEIGHWEYPIRSKKGCPFDWFKAEEIYNGVRRGLKRREEVVGYIANMFMDVVDNINVAYFLRGKYKGQVWFYYDQGKSNKGFSPLYDWFVRIQEDLWMDEKDKKLLKTFHSRNPLINRKVKKLKEKLFKELGLKKGYHTRNLEILMNKGDWERQAEIFARLASELLKYGLPKELLTGGERIGNKSKLERKIEDPNFRKEVVKKRWRGGKTMPNYMKAEEVLKHFYQGLAKEIPISALSFGENLAFPIVGYGRVESEEITKKIGINEDGELAFYKPKHWWEMQIPVKKSIGGIPNLYFILDCSGSMKEGGGRKVPNGEWGIRSKYHFALLGFYGILNYLERMRIIPEKIAITSFSSYSRSVIASYENLRKIEEILFSPVLGDTFVDLQQVRSIAKNLGKYIIIMLSDGEIHNWDEVKKGMKEIMRKNYSAFISIKSKSYPFYDLREVAKVFYVESAEDISKIMLDFASKAYRGLI